MGNIWATNDRATRREPAPASCPEGPYGEVPPVDHEWLRKDLVGWVWIWRHGDTLLI